MDKKNLFLLASTVALATPALVIGLGSEDTEASVQFTDVKADHYAYDAIVWAQSQGIVSGYTDKNDKPTGKFGPNDSVTEAQFAKMLSEFLQLKDDKGDLIKYTSSTVWSDTFYDALAAYGVPLNGYFDNSLRNKPVKRGVVAQAIGHLSGNSNSLTDSVNYMIGEGITTGQNPQFENSDLFKYFGSNNTLTRAQIVAFLYRMHNKDINEPIGIALVARKNEEGLSLVRLANKGMNKLDKSLRLGKLGSEIPVNGSGNNNGGTTNPPFENQPDFSDAKLPVSASANTKEVDVDELNKVASHLSSKTIDLFESNGYEVIHAYKGSIYTKPFGLTLSSDPTSPTKCNFNYDDGTDLEFVKAVVKDLSGVTLTNDDLSKNTRVDKDKVIITKSNSGRDITILK